MTRVDLGRRSDTRARPLTPRAVPRERRRRRPLLVLAVLVTLTAVVLGADVVRPGSTAAVRGAAAAVLGPVERLLAGPRDTTVEEARLAAATAQAGESAAGRAAAVESLLGAPALAGARVLPARVVAFASDPARGSRRVTLDVGSRDGVTVDRAVVTADGLVGRVVSVAPWTCDVLVVGDASLVVGVRSATGRIGTVDPVAAPGTTRAAGELSVALVEPGALTPGETLVTVGSARSRPYPADLPVATVVRTDARPGALTASAAVRPLVDPATLDVVGVLLSDPSGAPRAPLRAGRP